jgi:hypothetical protein
MVTPKSVVETTPLVIARIKQLERAQRRCSTSRPERRPPRRDRRGTTRLVPAP